MKKITRTIYGAKLQTAMFLGMPFEMDTHTTLNEYFGVEAGVEPSASVYPRARYFCIGNGAHYNATAADGFPYTGLHEHAVQDAALWKPLPFVIRELDDDLDSVTRAQYALRKEITVSGQQYVAYYLKRMDFTDVEITMLHNTVANNVTTSIPFVPSSANLNPQVPEIPNTGVITTDGTYLSVSAMLQLAFSALDVEEFINACNILFGDAVHSVISEFGIVTAVDKISTATTPDGQINYLEVIAAQIATHLTAHYPVVFNNEGFDYRLEIGSTESLYAVDPP